MTARVTDEAGLLLTTTAKAADLYRWGIRCLSSSGADALVAFDEAAREDPGFALAHAAGAAASASTGGATRSRLAAACQTASQGSRRERQHVEVVKAALDGDPARALALGTEHLAEFPGDVVVRRVLEESTQPDASLSIEE